MTEKEKMLAGELYDPGDGTLSAARMQAKDLCHQYNLLPPSQTTARERLLRALLGKTHGTFVIEQPFWCDYGSNIEVGAQFYANHGLTVLDGNKVTFGDQVLVGPNCGFYTAGHPLDAALRKQGLEYARPITVGDNVWIGGNVCVLPGVTIGDNAVIGAGSVVTQDIPPNVLAAGNPCKVIKAIA